MAKAGAAGPVPVIPVGLAQESGDSVEISFAREEGAVHEETCAGSLLVRSRLGEARLIDRTREMG